MSQALTPTNLIGNGVATLVVAKWERALDERRLQQALGGSASASASSWRNWRPRQLCHFRITQAFSSSNRPKSTLCT
jgi:hypothetical protein